MARVRPHELDKKPHSTATGEQFVLPFIDMHCHATPIELPGAPDAALAPRWPCMRCTSSTEALMTIGDVPFRPLDSRSWDGERRIADMARDGVDMQVVSPMPELLSYWLSADSVQPLCDAVNHQIADLVAAYPGRFRGLGALPMQDPERAVQIMSDLRSKFGLSGLEIGSNIDGVMLGDPRFDIIWEAAQDLDLAIFVHALHPVAAKPITSSPVFTAMALFPTDVGMAVASLLIGGVMDRFPRLKLGFSHGGGTIGAILGRLDVGWAKTEGFKGVATRPPSAQAKDMFFDSNVYDANYLRHIAQVTFPGQIFAGTDYPYDIMQMSPLSFIEALDLEPTARESLFVGAASRFLSEDLAQVVAR